MSVLHTKLRRDLRRSRAQIAAVVITIFLGITIFGASFDAFHSLQASYDELYGELGFADLWVTGGNTAGFATAAAEDAQVAAVETRHRADVGLVPEGGHSLFGRVLGIPGDGPSEVNRLMVLDGRRPVGGDEALAEQHFASHFDLVPGSTVTVASPAGPRVLVVSGVVESAEYIWPSRSRQEILTSPDDFGVIFVPDDQVIGLAGQAATAQAMIRYKPDGDDEATDARLGDVAAAFSAADTYTELEQASNSGLQEDVKGFGDLALMFPILFLTAAGLGTWVLLNRIVVSQQGVIGMLAANGMARRTLFRHYLGFGIVTGLGGAVPGVVAGALLARIVARVYTDALSIPVTVIRVEAATLVIGIAFGLITGVLAALTPAWRATRLQPADAMRGAGPRGPGRPTLAERILPPLRRLPATGRMVLRGVFRNRRRTTTTILGVVLAMTLILSSWGMIDTVDILVDRHFNDIDHTDAQIVLTGPPTAASVAAVAAVPGIAAAEPLIQASVSLQANGERYATVLGAYAGDTQMRDFLTAGTNAMALPDNGLLVGDSLQDLLRIEAGDVIDIRIPDAGITLHDTVAGFVDEPMGTFAYASWEHLAPLVAVEGANLAASGAVTSSALARLEPGVTLDDVRPALEHMDGVAAVTGTRSLEETIHSFLGLFYAFVGIMLAFGGALAFALIFNAMSVNLAERTVEVATLRASGVSPRRLARLVTAENLIVTGLGLVAGLPIGYWAASQFMAAYDDDQFSFILQMRTSTLVFSSLFILLVTFLSQWPGLKTLRSVDIASVVRERAL